MKHSTIRVFSVWYFFKPVKLQKYLAQMIIKFFCLFFFLMRILGTLQKKLVNLKVRTRGFFPQSPSIRYAFCKPDLYEYKLCISPNRSSTQCLDTVKKCNTYIDCTSSSEEYNILHKRQKGKLVTFYFFLFQLSANYCMMQIRRGVCIFCVTAIYKVELNLQEKNMI
uniref:Transmembrane protein n=1 Tax=Pyxicephalus adspersus TaxID=30357 RepID=A0AAV3A7J0_PYXAD|nr:TPA: hypothetical protein GDO54_018213 [Pyxicephalus adspersus]